LHQQGVHQGDLLAGLPPLRHDRPGPGGQRHLQPAHEAGLRHRSVHGQAHQ
ncbi:unnamed protein product, partial [Effrenium voratum]